MVIVLEKENWVRLRDADPIDMNTDAFFVPQQNAKGIELLIAYEEDREKLLSFKNDLAGLVKYLERGRTVYDGEVKPPSKI